MAPGDAHPYLALFYLEKFIAENSQAPTITVGAWSFLEVELVERWT